MISKSIYARNSWLTCRSALFADNAAKSPVQHLIENVLGKTRQYIRGFFQNKPVSISEIFWKQRRLPAEFISKPTFASKLRFTLYRPGNIYKLTSRWRSNSLTNSLRADLLRKFYRGGSGPILCLVGFSLAKKPSLLTDEEELEGVSYLIRDSFSSLSWTVPESMTERNDILYTTSLSDLKIGELIAKGCNAAIYSACPCDAVSKKEKETFEQENMIIEAELQDSAQKTSNCMIAESELSRFEGKENSRNETETSKVNNMIIKAELQDLVQKTSDHMITELELSHMEGKQSSRKEEETFKQGNLIIKAELQDSVQKISDFMITELELPHIEGKQKSKKLEENVESAETSSTPKMKERSKSDEDIYDSQFLMPSSGKKENTTSFVCPKDAKFLPASFGSYTLALKVMFNYSAESNAYAIWNAMYKETLPLLGEFSLGFSWKSKKKKKLKPHPNIVEMYSSFADQLPLLPGAISNYPLALPPRLQNDGCGRNMTLFLVMKRYHCCLKEYLLTQNITSETSLLLFTQLLEGLVHLLQNGITHRDLKSDNILLDLSQGISSPRLVITDFGCCLENLSLPYTTCDTNKGGNMTLMAPEVVSCEPGPFSVIDYHRADLWAAGAIAYEIFGESNPFYANSSLKSYTYDEKDLHPFPKSAPETIKKLVSNMLRVNPKQRPSQNFAATVCQVLLNAPPSLLAGPLDKLSRKEALKWMFQFSAQTYLESTIVKEDISVKLEMCRTFCSRIQYLEIIQALEYILDP